MVAERRETRPELTVVAPVTKNKLELTPYQSGGHATLIAEAQLAGEIRLTPDDLVTRPEIVHPLYRGLLQSHDIVISNFGLSKTVDRETGERIIVEFSRAEK